MGQCKVCAISHAGPSAGFSCVQTSWFKTGGVVPCVLAGVGNQKGAPWKGVVAEVSNAMLVFIVINVPCHDFLDHDTCSSAHAITRSTYGSPLLVGLWDLFTLSHFIDFLLWMQMRNLSPILVLHREGDVARCFLWCWVHLFLPQTLYKFNIKCRICVLQGQPFHAPHLSCQRIVPMIFCWYSVMYVCFL